MRVISDSSPLISLARIGKLNLLRALYGRVLVPTAVFDEVVVAGGGLAGAEEIGRANWIQQAEPMSKTDSPIGSLHEGLGAGERAVIQLALSVKADLVLMDDWKARQAALNAGLSVAGCVAVLEAGARGLVSDLRAAYVELLRQGIRLHVELLQESLAKFGLSKL